MVSAPGQELIAANLDLRTLWAKPSRTVPTNRLAPWAEMGVSTGSVGLYPSPWAEFWSRLARIARSKSGVNWV